MITICFSCNSFKKIKNSSFKLSKPIIKEMRYSPLHPAQGKNITISARLIDTSGLKSASLSLYVYKLYMNQDSLPSKKKYIDKDWGTIEEWNFSGESETIINYNYQKPIPANAQFVFELSVKNQSSQTTTKSIHFDVGGSKWPQDKILLYGESDDDLSKTINICFIADTDYYDNWDDFKSQIEGLIFDGFHTNNKINPHKEKWKFFYTRQSLDGQALYNDYLNTDLYPAYLTEGTIEGIDAFALIHQTEYGDASYLSSNLSFLSFNMFSSESFNYGTAIHECGHAIFNLYDEYNGCACTRSQGGSNIFTSQEECQQFLNSQGIIAYECPVIENYKGDLYYVGEENIFFNSLAECEEYNAANNYENDCLKYIKSDGQELYRAENGVCIMQDDGNQKVNKFQQVCSSIIDKYYTQLGPQNNLIFDQVVENYYNYQPVLLTEYTIDNDIDELKLNKISYGIPSKSSMGDSFMNFEFKDTNDIKVHQLNIVKPSKVLVHKNNEMAFEEVKKSKKIIKIPVNKAWSKINCIKLQDNNARSNNVLEMNIDQQLNSLKDQFNQKH